MLSVAGEASCVAKSVLQAGTELAWANPSMAIDVGTRAVAERYAEAAAEAESVGKFRRAALLYLLAYTVLEESRYRMLSTPARLFTRQPRGVSTRRARAPQNFPRPETPSGPWKPLPPL